VCFYLLTEDQGKIRKRMPLGDFSKCDEIPDVDGLNCLQLVSTRGLDLTWPLPQKKCYLTMNEYSVELRTSNAIMGELVANVQRTSLLHRLFIPCKTIRHEAIREKQSKT